jgi:hypothetical protein
MNLEHYDIALSFAGEDRIIAEEIFDALTEEGVRVFYDDNEQAELWGKDLFDYLSDIYLNRAKYCVILVSQHYLDKVWTNHERKNAQARAIRQKREYILPIMLDNSKLAGFETVAFLKWPQQSVSSITQKILYKLGVKPLANSRKKKQLTSIPGWSPPIIGYLRPDLKSEHTFTEELKDAKNRSLLFAVSLVGSVISALFLIKGIVSVFGEGNSPKNNFMGILMIAAAVFILSAAYPYLTSFYYSRARLYPYNKETSRGKYVGGSQFVIKEKELLYYYEMSMKCVFPGCDGVVKIIRRPTESEKYYIASCDKRRESHRYKVFDNGVAVGIE